MNIFINDRPSVNKWVSINKIPVSKNGTVDIDVHVSGGIIIVLFILT